MYVLEWEHSLLRSYPEFCPNNRSCSFQSRLDPQQQTGSGRTYIVSDVTSIIGVLMSMLDTLKPARRALKEQYYDQMATKFYLPDKTTGAPPASGGAANQVACEFRSWADRAMLPPGEADLVMSAFGSVSGIAGATYDTLPDVIDESSKHKLLAFFHGSEVSPPHPVGMQNLMPRGSSHAFLRPQHKQDGPSQFPPIYEEQRHPSEHQYVAGQNGIVPMQETVTSQTHRQHRTPQQQQQQQQQQRIRNRTGVATATNVPHASATVGHRVASTFRMGQQQQQQQQQQQYRGLSPASTLTSEHTTVYPYDVYLPQRTDTRQRKHQRSSYFSHPTGHW